MKGENAIWGLEVENFVFIEHIWSGEVIILFSGDGSYECVELLSKKGFGDMTTKNCKEWISSNIKWSELA